MTSPLLKRLSPLAPFLILLALTLAMFRDVLFTAQEVVVSRAGLDMSGQFLYWRDFAFRRLGQGELPLWNPHIFSGAPFLGGFQAALLYPPNVIFLILPLARAVNVSVAFHVFLIGAFMYLWTSYRGLKPLACLMSSAIAMFSGPYFLHVYAGHLSNLCAMSWTPLILLAVEALCRRPSRGWALAGVFASAMQILAGHPQYVYYTAIAAVIYACLLFGKSERKPASAMLLLAVVLGAGALTAVQIMTGMEASAESVRSLGLPYKFAAMFSFPPENFLTWLAPRFYGNMTDFPYWGRWYLWEMSLFMGLSGFALAVYGALCGARRKRNCAPAMALLLLVLALGAHTPLFRMLYERLPGFNMFRGASKFIHPAALFLALLSGVGLDDLMQRRRPTKFFAPAMLLAGLILAAAALLIQPGFWAGATDLWRGFIGWEAHSGASYLPAAVYADADFPASAAAFAARALLEAAVICLIMALLLLSMRRAFFPLYLIALLATAEAAIFAYGAKASFPLSEAVNPQLAAFYKSHPGDYRVLNLANPNSGMSQHALDIWGYDPGVPLRYARFMAFTQGEDPDRASQYLSFRRYHPLYRMLRCRYVITPRERGLLIREMAAPMPRLNLVGEWEVLRQRDAILRKMSDKAFDPRRTAVLERAPFPGPEKTGAGGTVAIESSSTDHLQISAKLPQASLLVITDSYSRGWRARALPGSAQSRYEVMPADYILLAVPLKAGAHSFVLEYAPRAFAVGKWISLSALGIYVVILIVHLAACRRKKRSAP